MPWLQENISQKLIEKYGNGGNMSLPKITLDTLKREFIYRDVIKIYQALGGVLTEPPIQFGRWDIVVNGFIVEFDEEQHFNRYRAKTLESLIYGMHSGFNVNCYIKYCQENEDLCLKKASWGKYWTSQSTERQFGPSDKYGLLGDLGSARWKQRAFFDYLRDIYSIIYKIPVLRISIYDLKSTDLLT